MCGGLLSTGDTPWHFKRIIFVHFSITLQLPTSSPAYRLGRLAWLLKVRGEGGYEHNFYGWHIGLERRQIVAAVNLFQPAPDILTKHGTAFPYKMEASYQRLA
jgi:hypothetical protein